MGLCDSKDALIARTVIPPSSPFEPYAVQVNPTSTKALLLVPQNTSFKNMSPHSPSSSTSNSSLRHITAFDFVPQNSQKMSKVYKLDSGNIGSGTFGEVRKAIHLTSKERRAVKIFYKNKLDKRQLDKIMQEINIMVKLDHPNVVKFYEYFVDEKFVFIVMELVVGGELFDKIHEKKRFSEKDAAIIFFQLLSAINYLHKHNIVHRDIKPENVLMDKNFIKLIDFGCSKEFKIGETITKVEGTPYYIAPEVLGGKYNEKCDEWSAGIILYILLCGQPPFNGKSQEEIFNNVLHQKLNFNPKTFDLISVEAKDLISKLLNRDITQRLSAEEALQHPWLKTFEQNPIEIPTSVLSNIKQFDITSKLQQSIYRFFVSNLTSKEERDEMAAVFRKFDLNNDGVISREELNFAYKNMNTNLTEEDIQDLVARIDSNNSGAVDYSEFIAAALDRKKLLSEERIKQCFILFDKDGDGKISEEEIKLIFQGKKGMNDNVFSQMIKEVDKNKNGMIDFDEFKDLLIKLI